jgi:hypothetical protein
MKLYLLTPVENLFGGLIYRNVFVITISLNFGNVFHGQFFKINIFVYVLVINQLDVTLLISLFTLYMFRTILVHHQDFCFVRHAGLTKVCGALEWYPLFGVKSFHSTV